MVCLGCEKGIKKLKCGHYITITNRIASHHIANMGYFVFKNKTYASYQELKELRTSRENEEGTNDMGSEANYGKLVFTSFHNSQAPGQARITQPLPLHDNNFNRNNYVIFIKCKFVNVSFTKNDIKSILFFGCVFEKCKFEHCYFTNCSFSIEGNSNEKTSFIDCLFDYILMANTICNGTSFITTSTVIPRLGFYTVKCEKCSFVDVNFKKMDIVEFIIDNCVLNNIDFHSCTLVQIGVINNTIIDEENGITITRGSVEMRFDRTVVNANNITYEQVYGRRYVVIRDDYAPPPSFLIPFFQHIIEEDAHHASPHNDNEDAVEDADENDDEDADEDEYRDYLDEDLDKNILVPLFDVLSGNIRKNKQYKPEIMQRKRLQKSNNPVTKKDTYHDLIELEDKSVIETVNRERNMFAFKIHNEFYVISRDELIRVMNMPTNIRYECPQVDSFTGIKMEQPYLNLPSIGAVITGVVSFFDLWNIIKSDSNIRHKVFELVPTDKLLASTASYDAVYNTNYISGAHCQSGQESRVYDIRIMWADVKVPLKSHTRRIGKQNKTRTRTRSRSHARSRETKKAKSFTRSKSSNSKSRKMKTHV